MSYETIEIESENADKTHVLTGTIVSIGDSIAEVNIDDYGTYSDIPVFYHCPESETADGMPFTENDRVIIVNSGDAITLSVSDMKVVGFEDGLPRYCPVETVYVLMQAGTTQRCFVWDASKNTYASVNKNDGNPASFPCDPADISNWLSKQSGVGDGLFTASNCGRLPFYAPELSCPAGNWGTAGSTSDSKEAPSDCGCDFIDIGECTTSWDFTTECHPTGTWWIWAGSSTATSTQHILYKHPLTAGGQSKKLTFLNNSNVESAFRIELQYDTFDSGWSADGAGCSGAPCDSIRLDSGIYSSLYKFHTPILLNILEINYTSTKSWDYCADVGAYAEINNPIKFKLNNIGAYSDKIIVQIYTVEARTVSRNMNGVVAEWCIGDCTWLNEVYTASGLKIAAQVGTFEDTDGIDPTGLSRNASFESVITEMYDALRILESIAEDDIAQATISTSIYRG